MITAFGIHLDRYTHAAPKRAAFVTGRAAEDGGNLRGDREPKEGRMAGWPGKGAEAGGLFGARH